MKNTILAYPRNYTEDSGNVAYICEVPLNTHLIGYSSPVYQAALKKCARLQ